MLVSTRTCFHFFTVEESWFGLLSVLSGFYISIFFVIYIQQTMSCTPNIYTLIFYLGCLHYGNDFSKYPDFSTRDHNTENVFNVNEAVCLASCLNTTKFLCISAELGLMFGLTHCHMSKEGYLDVPMEDRCPNSKDYFFFTRNCMPRYTITCR